MLGAYIYAHNWPGYKQAAVHPFCNNYASTNVPEIGLHVYDHITHDVPVQTMLFRQINTRLHKKELLD